MNKTLPFLIVTLIFSLVLNLSLPSFKYINTHDEDDNIVSGFLMSRNGYRMSRDIFTHHLPGAYLISEVLDQVFQPTGTDEGVFVHRTFVVVWNYLWALATLALWGPLSLWLVLVVELLRANYLYSLFQAENLVIYPMTYLLLTLITGKKIRPVLSGLAGGLISILLSPLWPLVLLTAGQFFFLNRKKFRNILLWSLAFLLPVIWTLWRIDIGEFLTQFFGYNTLTYAPLLMKKPLLFIPAAFLAPGMVMFDFSFQTKVVVIQLLVLFLFIFGFRKKNLKSFILFGLLLGIIGFRSTPRFHNPVLDFHILPWLVTLATLCWYRYFYLPVKMTRLWLLILILPAVFYLAGPSNYFPSKEQAGKMVIRYQDSSPLVRFFLSSKSAGDTLLTLPAHTLLYEQTGIRPFNQFLFYLPWMEKSPVLYSRFTESFRKELPTYIFIDSIHFPYTPPVEIQDLLENYDEVKLIEDEPPVYVLKK